jgi:hypothetical protein
MHHLFRLCCACAGLALAGSAAAGVPPGQVMAGWTPVSAGVLEGARGGFTLDSGLAVSLGIERLVSINGNVVSRTSFAVADMSRLTAEQAEQTRAALSSVNLVRNGHDTINAGALTANALGGTVIQNSLNDQVIKSATVITAGVNSMGLLKALNFQDSLGEAIARSVVHH